MKKRQKIQKKKLSTYIGSTEHKRSSGSSCDVEKKIDIGLLLRLMMQIDPPFQEPSGDNPNQTVCRVKTDANWPLFQLTFFLVSYVVPLTLICGLYICMLLRLWRGVRTSAESRRGRRRVTRMVIVVVGVFAICWCPIQVIFLDKHIDKKYI